MEEKEEPLIGTNGAKIEGYVRLLKEDFLYTKLLDGGVGLPDLGTFDYFGGVLGSRWLWLVLILEEG